MGGARDGATMNAVKRLQGLLDTTPGEDLYFFYFDPLLGFSSRLRARSGADLRCFRAEF